MRFGPGLNVITGETGAGKTVLAHSLDLLMGGRPRSAIVRPGAEEAWVEGTLRRARGAARRSGARASSPTGIPAGEEVVLARRVSAGSGRSSAFIAGRSASAADLRALGSRLLAFYGQHEHRKLTLTAAQGEILDGFAGTAHLELVAAYRAAHAEVVALVRERDELARPRGRPRTRHRPAPLRARRDRRRGDRAGRGRGARRRARPPPPRRVAARGRRHRAARDRRRRGGRRRLGARSPRPKARSGAAPTSIRPSTRSPSGSTAASVELADLAAELRDYLEGIEAEPGRLEEVETRLGEIDRLIRKHGGSAEAVLAHAEHCRAELERLERAAERGSELDAALAEAEAKRAKLGEKLSKSRGDGRAEARDATSPPSSPSSRWTAPGSRSRSSPRRRRLRRRAGCETVELRVATNPGMPIAPLSDAASGGELSRVMLALLGHRPGRRGRDARLRRDRRRRRRQGRAPRRRAAAVARRGPPGRLHHPPRAGRLAGLDPLPGRQGGRRRGDGRPGRCGQRRRSARRDRPHARRRQRRRGRGQARKGAADCRIIGDELGREAARTADSARPGGARHRSRSRRRRPGPARQEDEGPRQAARARRDRGHRPRRPRPDRRRGPRRVGRGRGRSTSRRSRPTATRTSGR